MVSPSPFSNINVGTFVFICVDLRRVLVAVCLHCAAAGSAKLASDVATKSL